jgi:hypothetical protein
LAFFAFLSVEVNAIRPLALHLASSGGADGFAAFDQKMAKRAGTLQAIEMVLI